MENRQVFSQDTTEVLEDRMVSGDQWNHIGKKKTKNCEIDVKC
jgi:hypothetical protein